MGNSISLSMKEWIALGIFVPSGLNKMLNPQASKEMWPRLPHWFWFPCGAWEIAGVLALTVASPHNKPAGFGLLYPFMGGVFSSLLWITDGKGHTHASGKGKLGAAGLVPLVPATLTTGLLYSLDDTNDGFMVPLALGALGFGFGVFVSSRVDLEEKSS